MTNDDHSELLEGDYRQLGRSEARPVASAVRSSLSGAKSVIVFASARGGSGKSLLTATLAGALAAKGRKVGIIDADVDSPSIQAILGMRRARVFSIDGGIEPAAGPLGLRVIAASMLAQTTAGDPFVVGADPSAEADPPRGEVASAENGTPFAEERQDSPALLARIFEQGRFGRLDFLFIDLRSGIESIRTLARLQMTGGLLMVTAPSQLATNSTRRAIDEARRLRLPVWGIVENMVGFYCEHCRSVRPLFEEGGVASLASETNIPLLARLPFEPRLAAAGDRGILFTREYSNTPMAAQLLELAKRIEELALAAAKPASSATT